MRDPRSDVPVREPMLRAAWALSLYPDAGEASGSFGPTWQRPRTHVPGTPAVDPERSRRESARRARTGVRRYCAANRLDRMGTLTYRGEGIHDPRQVRRDVAVFFRSLRSALGGKPFPYLWAPEWHKTDHGLHLHFAVGKFINYRLIRSTWGHGDNVWIHRHSDLPVGASSLYRARLVARYLSKYITKDFDVEETVRLVGLHRYDVAQGYRPRRIGLPGRSVAEGLQAASEHMGARPSSVWYSADSEDWQAPPAVWFGWD
jgi:hypothetical protein